MTLCLPNLLALLLIASNTITCLRLLLFRRGTSRYRPIISIAAWVLIASSGSIALSILFGLYPKSDIHLGDIGLSLVLCVLSITAQGNVASILRTDRDQYPTSR